MRLPASRKLVILACIWWVAVGSFALVVPDVHAAAARSSRKPKVTPPIRTAATLSEILPDDQQPFTIDVTVTLPLNVIGSRTFTAKEVGSDTGMMVRAYGSDVLPAFTAGDTVRIIGQRKAVSRGLPTLGTTGKKMTRLSPGEITYASRDPGTVNESVIGSATLLKGTVTHTTKRAFSLSDNRGEKEIEVVFPKTAHVPKISLGSTVEVRGVLLTNAAGTQLVAADAKAAKVVAPPKSEEAASQTDPHGTETQSHRARPSTPQSQRYWLAGFAALATLIAATSAWAIRRRNALNEDILSENR